jgi:hypothetical protein
MKTCTRRFILRLIIGLLTFAIGVGAAMLLGGFRPFDSFSSPTYYRHRGYYYYRSEATTTDPAFVYPVYRKHRDCRLQLQFDELPPPPAVHMDAPMPPPPPRPLR